MKISRGYKGKCNSCGTVHISLVPDGRTLSIYRICDTHLCYSTVSMKRDKDLDKPLKEINNDRKKHSKHE
jgi:hypothetical protein